MTSPDAGPKSSSNGSDVRFGAGLPDDQRHAVHEREVEGELVPQGERADQVKLVLVLEQLEFSDAERTG